MIGASSAVTPGQAGAAAGAAATPVVWGNDLEAAKKQASQDGRDILVSFTGSDWCGKGIKLKKEVFDQPAFAAAADQFVLMEADFPENKQLPADVTARNMKLQKELRLYERFPSVFLLDANGRPFARTGYNQGGADNYLKVLASFRAIRVKRDAAWAKAQDAQGVEKAKLLAEGLTLLNHELRPHYADVVAQIKALDPQDSTGLVHGEELRIKINELFDKIEDFDAKHDPAAARKAFNDFVAEHKLAGEKGQGIAILKLGVYPPSSLASLEKAEMVLDLVLAMGADTGAGKSAAHIKAAIPMLKARVEKKPEPKAETK